MISPTNTTLATTIHTAIADLDREVYFTTDSDQTIPAWVDMVDLDTDSGLTELRGWLNERTSANIPTTMYVRSYVQGNSYHTSVDMTRMW